MDPRRVRGGLVGLGGRVPGPLRASLNSCSDSRKQLCSGSRYIYQVYGGQKRLSKTPSIGRRGTCAVWPPRAGSRAHEKGGLPPLCRPTPHPRAPTDGLSRVGRNVCHWMGQGGTTESSWGLCGNTGRATPVYDFASGINQQTRCVHSPSCLLCALPTTQPPRLYAERRHCAGFPGHSGPS